ncbi:hypothetical protein [Ponticaulis sp.]|uniref:hypothetical protein n=1 Tax=Ponticaulis sp. TaxID=2020902 RepID=UPI000C62B046|nr:hypothetical protein [Ponticaulis sp.]MAF59105.1 hypothetical protein [Ponticaulis sp.]MBN03035.1 hypothetical protein [Ponticaulis sp.]
MKKQTWGSLLAISGITAPAAFAHSDAGASHSHLGANVSHWLGHVLTSPGHQLIVAGLGILLVAGLTAFKMLRASNKKSDFHSE